jgi:hypothetical protein
VRIYVEGRLGLSQLSEEGQRTLSACGAYGALMNVVTQWARIMDLTIKRAGPEAGRSTKSVPKKEVVEICKFKIEL